jgi:glycosyltransferase involved in cell wall biosynthesis
MARTVLFFESHSGFFDGAQQSLYLLLTHLDRRRFRPIFVGPEEGLLTRQLQKAGVRTIIAPPDGRLGRYGGAVLRDSMWKKCRLGPAYFAYARRIRRIFRDEGVEVVHCNSIRSLLTVGPAARIARIPLIWHLRLNLDLGAWNRVGLMLADRVIVVGDRLRESFPGKPGDPGKFVTVYNGLDMREWDAPETPAQAPEILEIYPGWQAVGMTGCLTPRKGQLDLLRAANAVIRARPQTKFVIVGEARGDEAEAYAERLRAYVEAAMLEGHVIFTGWRSDVRSILRQLDLYVLPSLNEGFPRGILEAMACSLPVVATRVGSNAELVMDGQTGLLVPAEDPDALAAAMLRMLQDPELASSMGRLGQQRVETEFSLEASVRGVEQVIEDLAVRRRGIRWNARRRKGAAVSSSRG